MSPEKEFQDRSGTGTCWHRLSLSLSLYVCLLSLLARSPLCPSVCLPVSHCFCLFSLSRAHSLLAPFLCLFLFASLLCLPLPVSLRVVSLLCLLLPLFQLPHSSVCLCLCLSLSCPTALPASARVSFPHCSICLCLRLSFSCLTALSASACVCD